MENKEFKNFRFVSKSTLGTFYVEGFGFINITHSLDDGGLSFGKDAIFGKYYDLVHFFTEHCTSNHQIIREFWEDAEQVKSAWESFYRMNISDSTTRIELANKCELLLAEYQEYGEFYKNLFRK